jgi:hypothetical protein
VCTPIIAGVASFASGALGAVGQYQAGQAANANAIASYKHQIQMREHDWRNQLSTWAHRRLEYKNEVRSNEEAANRGYAAEQTRLNEQFMQAAFQKQDMLVGLLQQQGLNGERVGNSAAKINQSLLSQYGRNNATIAASLSSARNAMTERQEDIRRQLQSGNQKAYSQVALRPIAGIAPQKPQLSNPGMGLMLGLGQAAIGGVSAFSSLKAPSAGNFGTNNWGGSGASNFQPNTNIPGINYGGVPSYAMPSGAGWANSFNYQT